MTAVLSKAFGDLRRHPMQAVVVALIVLLASGTGVIALTLMTQSNNPYDQAFAQQNGAHLQAYFNGAKVDSSVLPATAQAIGATEYAGPFPSGGIAIERGSVKFFLNLIGRDSPTAAVDRIHVVDGRWVSAPNEIALTKSFADLNNISIGARFKDVDLPQAPTVTVVGLVVDIDEGQADLSSQTAFVTASALSLLVPKDAVGYAMVYRFASAPTNQQLTKAELTLDHAVPPGALQTTVNYLLFKSVYGITGSLVTTMLLAFSVFALAAASLVVANMVAATVLANYRDIGVMKALGFTPRQVIAVYVFEMVLPALAGCIVGIPLGLALAQPLVATSATAVGLTTTSQLSPAVAAIALVGTLLIVALASLFPALRAGRLRTVDAIARGTAPTRARASRLGAVATFARLPYAAEMGFRDAYSRPLRGAFTTFAIVVGVSAAIFAIGLNASLNTWARSLSGDAAVVVTRTDGYSDTDSVAAISRQRGVSTVVAVTSVRVAVPGIADKVQAEVFRGDSRRLGLGVVRGHWFTGPGQALAPKATFDDAHLSLGGKLRVDDNGTLVTLTIVGEVVSVNDFGHDLMVDNGTFPKSSSYPQFHSYDVVFQPSIDATVFSRAVEAVSPNFLSAQSNTFDAGIVNTLNTVGLALATILVLIAVAGVFNTLLLTVRERRRDLATLKAVGMGPWQLVVMVCTSGAILGFVGGVIAVPVGLVLHRVLLTLFANEAGSGLSNGVFDVFAWWALPLFVAGGMAVAIAGGLLPARAAARTSVATVLHAE